MATPEKSQEELTGPWKGAYDILSLVILTGEAARHDHLTGMLTKDAWKHEIAERLQSDGPFGVIFMDMDSFKKINDTFRHERGDSILEQFGMHMRNHFRRAGDTLTHEKLFQEGEAGPSLGRYGGDEFGLIVDLSGNDKRSRDPIENMHHALEHLRSVLDDFVAEQPADIQELGFNMSVGSTIRNTGEQVTVSELVESADKAMYEAKRAHSAAR